MFFKNLTIWIILLIAYSPAALIPRIQTANVLVEQTVKIEDRNGCITEIYVPSGSVVFSPAYFDRLSESIALKDKILLESSLARPMGYNGLRLEKRLYIDTFYGLKSGPELTVGGRLDLVL
jgi:hypothetical protein